MQRKRAELVPIGEVVSGWMTCRQSATTRPRRGTPSPWPIK